MKRQATQVTGVATPASAAETLIATVNVPNLGDNPLIQGVVVDGIINITTGTTATAVVIRVRRTNISGAIVGTAQTHSIGAATNGSIPFSAFDSAPVPGVYVVTVSVTGQGSAGAANVAVVTATAA
jgi:hypothetical protein